MTEVVLLGVFPEKDWADFTAAAERELGIPVRYLSEYTSLGTAGGMYAATPFPSIIWSCHTLPNPPTAQPLSHAPDLGCIWLSCWAHCISGQPLTHELLVHRFLLPLSLLVDALVAYHYAAVSSSADHNTSLPPQKAKQNK